MNIDFNNLDIDHAAMHTIKRREEPNETGVPEFATELLVLTEPVINVIKVRLVHAMGMASKAFKLDVLHDHAGSFCQFVEEMRETGSATDFMDISKRIATSLASSQKKTIIPGGYLLVLNCSDGDRRACIVIKAEPHEALIVPEGQSQIALLKSVFLSPSQKLYKIGILCDKENIIEATRGALDKNERFDAYLFDDQFRIKSTPAEYFYRDFLGFTISENAKIQSQKFYDITENFIKTGFTDIDQKTDLLRVLRDEFNLNMAPSVSPAVFADTYFPQQQADAYKVSTQFELPLSIIKDPVLIKSKISKRQVEFPGNIYLTAPNDVFEENVKLISGSRLEETIRNTDVNRFTFVRIAGRPYSNE
ncbi:MAG: hypothetical protein JWR12_3012 [Mucilaginibacter sp.]|nr:hypothetical protein [Mucilaginibacter sp.]